MKLLLTSSGFTNDSIRQAFLAMCDKPVGDMKLAFIPTAANVVEGDKEWLIDDLDNCRKLGFSEIDIVDFSAIPKAMWLPRLQSADAFLFGGGNTFHLMYCLERFGLKEELPSLLTSRIYVGISAGSMVTTNSLILSQSAKLYTEYSGKLKNDDQGLGFVKFHIRPHLNSEWFPSVRIPVLEKLAEKIPDPIYALDDNSAVSVIDEKIEVVSEGEWKKFN